MKARKVKGLDPREPLIENAARIVATRLDELRGFVPGALKQRNATEQHDMRIAAKRLRYVLETTEFCFGDAAETARRRAKALQEVLGEIHDCDVMLPRIEDQISNLREEDAVSVRELAGDAADLDPELSARAPHRTAYRGLEVLAIHVKARRRLLFDRFVALWDEIEREGSLRQPGAGDRQIRRRGAPSSRGRRASSAGGGGTRGGGAGPARGRRARTRRGRGAC